MGNTDPGLRGGNTPPARDLKFGKVSDVFAETKRAEIASALEAARQIFQDNSEQSIREWGEGPQREYKVTLTERSCNRKTHIVSVPAEVAYSSTEREAHARAELERKGDDSNPRQSLGSALAVTFNPEASDSGVFTFDFDAKDPVEEVAILGQSVSVDGSPLTFGQGVDLVMQVITEAADSTS
jgi:hypothetical protein